MTGVEIDLVVPDSLKALELYEHIFEVERLEVTGLEKGLNEAIFSIYGTRFHLLDENPAYQLLAPKSDESKSIWFNILVPDIHRVHNLALEQGCVEFQPVAEVPQHNMYNALFADPFGHLWMLHQLGESELTQAIEENLNL